MKPYKDLSLRRKQVRRLWLLLIVAFCGVVIGRQASALITLLTAP